MLLALHQFFLGQRHSPVPGFLVLDLPSQVSFPKNLVRRPDEDEQEPELRDEDIDAARKALTALSRVGQKSKGRLQVIVLDQAPRDVWGDIPEVVGPREWRDGVKVVPMKWLADSEEHSV